MASDKKNKRKKGRKRGVHWALKALIALLLAAACGLGVLVLTELFPNLRTVTVIVEDQEWIRKYAAENDLPPAYVAAVVMAESSYRTDAVSSVNAQGLMQILPETAEWIAGKFDEEYVEGCLFDAETNLRYGCWYLGWLLERYDGNCECASAAYHAGQGTVDKWLANPECSADGKTLDNIPYDSTRTYVSRVMKYKEKYEAIYAED